MILTGTTTSEAFDELFDDFQNNNWQQMNNQKQAESISELIFDEIKEE